MTISNDDLIKWVEQAEIAFSPAFVHGVLTAYCLSADKQHEWVLLLVPEINSLNHVPKEALQMLNTVQTQILYDLSSETLDFQLFESQSNDLTKQVLTTRDWVSGYWLGVNHLNLTKQITATDVLEFLQDIRLIAAMPLPKESEENDSVDLMEIQEYCRAGVINVFLNVRHL